MPIPFPDERTVDLSPPERAETLANAAGVLSATRLGSGDAESGNTEFQRLLMAAVDFMAIDWFLHADRPIADLRNEFNIVGKSTRAIEEGSASPWAPGGISATQLASGKLMAERSGIAYDPRGATI